VNRNHLTKRRYSSFIKCNLNVFVLTLKKYNKLSFILFSLIMAKIVLLIFQK